jgi:hypothetical protein
MWRDARMRGARIGTALFLTALLLLSGAASAGKEKGTETLEWGDTVAVLIDNTDGELLEIQYEVSVPEGVPVNVYFVDAEDLDAFNDPESSNLSYYKDHSVVGTRDAVMVFDWDTKGVFYVVIFNPGPTTSDNATVEYEVSWDVKAFDIWDPWCWVTGIVVLVGVFFAYTLLRLRGLPRRE